MVYSLGLNDASQDAIYDHMPNHEYQDNVGVNEADKWGEIGGNGKGNGTSVPEGLLDELLQNEPFKDTLCNCTGGQ